MVPLKLYLINKKISDIFKVDVNALAWIFIGIITIFVIAGTYLHHGDYLKDKYNKHFPEVKVEQVKQVENPIKETFEEREQNLKKSFSEIILMIMSFLVMLLLLRKLLFG